MKHFELGRAAADADQWEKARGHFEEAWRLSKHWKIAANLGRSELRTSKFRDAAEHLERFLREVPPDQISAEDRAKADELYKKALTRVGTITVEVSEPGAEVLVGGQPVGQSPLPAPVFVDPGPVSIEAHKEGYVPVKADVKATEGGTYPVTLRLVLPPAKPLPKKDDRIVVDIGQPKPWWKPWGIVAGAGVAAVGVGIGVGFTVAALNESEKAGKELEHLRNEVVTTGWVCQDQNICEVYGGHLDSMRTFRTVAIIGYAAGAVAAAGTVVMALWPEQRSAKSSNVRATPLLAPSVGGVLVQGNF